jgi:predicted enzyme related to lactoylglutathione lyase
MIVPENSVHYIEYVVKDPEQLVRAFEKQHPWRFAQASELAGSWVAELPGGGLCGIRGPMNDDEKRGLVVRTYVRVADLDRAVAIARENGATIAIESMSVGKYGRIAIYVIEGVQQGLWQVS